eukprot:GEMP01029988.1.p1 GENE.GEMP01029988.1~~GEMP01029988.1.p1  ORF type:complete len:243 (+),score=41.19 GEMP01029988.1:54-731(+)
MQAYQGYSAPQGKPIEKFSTTWKVFFFAAAICVIGAAVLGFMWAGSELDAFKLVCEGYLCVFGLLMAVVDIPDTLSLSYLTEIRYSIFTYLMFMTRFTGRGLWYLFLGSMIISTLWHDNFVVALLLGGYVAALGLMAFCFGVTKSRQLEAVRQALKMREQEDVCDATGMTKEEFCEIAINIRGQVWDDEMITYVLNAMSLEIKADDRITREEFNNWLEEPLMALL